MLTSETTVTVDRSGRYLAQFCRHAAAMGRTGGGHGAPVHSGRAALARCELQVHVERTETRGVVTISPWGRCTLDATGTTLVLRVEATDQDAMRRIQDIVTRDLERFGRRDGLTVSWPPPRALDTDPGAPDAGAMPSPGAKASARTGRRRALLVAVIAGVAIAAHAALGTAVLANARWTGPAVDVVLAIVLVKSLLVAFGGEALRARIRAGAHGRARAHHGRPGTDIPADEPARAGERASGGDPH